MSACCRGYAFTGHHDAHCQEFAGNQAAPEPAPVTAPKREPMSPEKAARFERLRRELLVEIEAAKKRATPPPE